MTPSAQPPTIPHQDGDTVGGRRAVISRLVSELEHRGFAVEGRIGMHMVKMGVVDDSGRRRFVFINTNGSSRNRSSQNTVAKINRALRELGIRELDRHGW
jgi:hypothetical protein